MKKAFSLVELIVVITVLTILGTITFISFSGYSIETRDTKRISDVRGLLNKVNLEFTKGSHRLSDLIDAKETNAQILGVVGTPIQTMGKVNFEVLKESGEDFKDPSTKRDYLVAYAVGGTETGTYNFVQAATISEKYNTTKILGNYYTTTIGDAPSLFVKGDATKNENYYREGGKPIYNVNETLPTITYSGEDVIVDDGAGNKYTIQDKNLGATGTMLQGDYYQWGRNDTGFTTGSSDSGRTWTEKAQGPCPEGYHIPSTDEWNGLFEAWCKYRWGEEELCTIGYGTSRTWSILGITSTDFQNDLKIPYVGYRSQTSGDIVTNQNPYTYAGYWSSSIGTSNADALIFNSDYIYPQGNDVTAIGFNIRCFKD